MGYYTKYNLKVKNSELPIDFYVDKLHEKIGYFYCFNPDGSDYEAIRWYNHSEHMVFLSKEYPDVLFILTGFGEDVDDIWIKYYKNGKYKVGDGEVIFPSYESLKFFKDYE